MKRQLWALMACALVATSCGGGTTTVNEDSAGSAGRQVEEPTLNQAEPPAPPVPTAVPAADPTATPVHRRRNPRRPISRCRCWTASGSATVSTTLAPSTAKTPRQAQLTATPNMSMRSFTSVKPATALTRHTASVLTSPLRCSALLVTRQRSSLAAHHGTSCRSAQEYGRHVKPIGLLAIVRFCALPRQVCETRTGSR